MLVIQHDAIIVIISTVGNPFDAEDNALNAEKKSVIIEIMLMICTIIRVTANNVFSSLRSGELVQIMTHTDRT